jgi:hypothetical protein
MQAQRARYAINSNKRESAPSLAAIRAHKFPFHEPYVRVEGVGGSSARSQVGPSPQNWDKVGLTDKPFKIKNQRRIVPGIDIDSLDWAREKEVKSWSSNVWDRYWKITLSRRAACPPVVVRPEICWICCIEQHGSASCGGTACEEITSGNERGEAGFFGFHTSPPDLRCLAEMASTSGGE